MFQQFAPAAFAAAVIAAVCSLLAIRLSNSWAKHSLLASSIGAAYVCGHIFVVGLPSFPPRDTTHWLLYFSLISIPIGVITSARHISGWVAFGMAIICNAGALALLLLPKFRHGWTPQEGALWTFSLTLIAAAIWLSFQRNADRISAMQTLLPFALTCAATSVALILSGSLLLGQLGSILAAAFIGMLLARSWKHSVASPVVPASSILLSGLIVCGYFFAELPPSS